MSVRDFIKEAPLRVKFMAVCAVGAIGLVGTYELQPERTTTVTVKEKARSWSKGGGLYDRVVTDKGVFAVYRADIRGGFVRNTSFNKLNDGCTYTVRSYGINVPLVMAPSIRGVEHVPTATCRINYLSR